MASSKTMFGSWRAAALALHAASGLGTVARRALSVEGGAGNYVDVVRHRIGTET
jgi:hypothetical protein